MGRVRLAITGATGYLGSHLVRRLLSKGYEVLSLARNSHAPFASEAHFRQAIRQNVIDREFLYSAVSAFAPHGLLHLAALSAPAQCESSPRRCHLVNIEYSQILIEICEALGVPFYFVSSDLVFDGAEIPDGGMPESGLPSPVSKYAQSKRDIETQVMDMNVTSAVLRSALEYGDPVSPGMGPEAWLHEAFRSDPEQEIKLFHDEWRTPAHVEDVAEALCNIAVRRINGVFHAAGPERLSRLELGVLFAKYHGYPAERIVAVSRKLGNPVPPRAKDVSLRALTTMEALGVGFRAPSEHYRAE